jgi:glycosyltransferase involved in cell wall biosynthesis
MFRALLGSHGPGSKDQDFPVNRVVIYRNALLPASETFIRDQAKALRNWAPKLVGNFTVSNGLDLSGLSVQLPTGGMFLRRLRQRFGLADPGLVEVLRASADLVHVHFGLDAVDAWPSIRRAGLPMLVTLHGYDITTHARWWRQGKGGLSRVIYPSRLARLFREPRVGFIAVSDAIRAQALAKGMPPNKIATCHIGIDVEKFKSAGTSVGARDRRVLFVGRLVEKKGVRFLINAMAHVRKHVPDATLTVVGDGPLHASLQAQAKATRVPTEFLGTLEDRDVRAQLARARVFCLPSAPAANGDTEGFGMVLLEAQACGVPVVTSASGGATEGLLEGRTGFSFPERDVDALAKALTTMLTDDALCARMAAEAPLFVRRAFDIRALTPQLESFYERACRRAPLTPGEWQ